MHKPGKAFSTPSATMEPAIPAALLSRLQHAGLRRTLATRAVIGHFLGRQGQGLTHTQVFAGLKARGISVDRVTLYRLLDRLVVHHVLRRQVDDARSFRYWLNHAGAPFSEADPDDLVNGSPAFECQSCHLQVPLTARSEALQDWWQTNMASLRRAGHAVETTRLRFVGTCPACQLMRLAPSSDAAA